MSTETRLPPSYEGSVVMDIGGDVGGLVVYTSEALTGEEIEIRVKGDDRPHSHTEVRPRRLPGQTLYAGVFPALPGGVYTLPNGSDVIVTGGQVTEVRW